jgi:hypothetical protein
MLLFVGICVKAVNAMKNANDEQQRFANNCYRHLGWLAGTPHRTR